MFAPQTDTVCPTALCVEIRKKISLCVLIQGLDFPLPHPLFPVYRFFFAVARLANFGVRLHVSIVAGGSVTTTILPDKAVLEGRGFRPNFSDDKFVTRFGNASYIQLAWNADKL